VIGPFYPAIGPFYLAIGPFYPVIGPFYPAIGPFYPAIKPFYPAIKPFYPRASPPVSGLEGGLRRLCYLLTKDISVSIVIRLLTVSPVLSQRFSHI